MEEKVKDAVDIALKKEQASYKHYIKLYNSSSNYNLQKLFNNLAIQELRHEALLKEFLETGSFFSAKENISGKYGNEIDITRELNPTEEITDMAQEIRKAMKKEEQSEKLYRELVNDSGNNELRALFVMLADEELKHWYQLKEELDKFNSN